MDDTARRCLRCNTPVAPSSVVGALCPRCLLSLAGASSWLEGDEAADVGSSCGPYILVRRLGEGGMGVVWLAEQRHPIKRSVAIKIVKRDLDSNRVLSRFDTERQTLAILNHPHIATVLDAGLADDGRPYFVMEYVPGQPITTFVDEHRLPIPERLGLFVQVCEAVQHAHQKGILHRDLKPTNILAFMQDGRPSAKVIDFGIAKAVGPRVPEPTLATELGVLLGTPEYMSPEQAELSTDSDTRSDVYSLGVVLYELLSGALPFDPVELRKRAVLEMLRVIREDEPPRLTTRLSRLGSGAGEVARRRNTEIQALLRQLRGDLEWITAKAITKDPAGRYATASELAADVRRHLTDEPVTASPPSVVYRVRKLALKHKAAAAASATLLLAIILGGAVAIGLWQRAELARRDSRERLKEVIGMTGLRLAGEGDGLRALPWLVAALNLEEGGAEAEDVHRIRIGNILTTSPIPTRTWVYEDLAGAHLAADRRVLVAWDTQGAVQLWEAMTGEPIGPVLHHPSPVVDARFDSTASRVVTADRSGTIRVWDPRNGGLVGSPIAHGDGLHLVRLGGGGETVLSADVQGGVRLWAAGEGRRIAEYQHGAPVTFAEFLDEGREVITSANNRTTFVTPTGSARPRFRIDKEVNTAEVRENRLLTVDRTGRAQAWHIDSGAAASEPTVRIPSGTWRGRFTRNGEMALLCGMSGAFLARMSAPRVPPHLLEAYHCIAADVAPGVGLAASGHIDGSVRVWRHTGESLTARLPHSREIAALGFLADNRHLLVADRNGLIRIWDLAPSAPAPRIAEGFFTWQAAFSPDGTKLALASGTSGEPSSGQVTVADANTFEVLSSPLRHGGNVRSVRFSADGRFVASASDDGTARLWEVASGEPVGPVLDAGYPLSEVRLSRDGQRLLTVASGPLPDYRPAILWEVPAGRRIAAIPAKADGTWALAEFSAGGRLLVANVPTGRVQVFNASDGSALPDADWRQEEYGAFLSDSRLALIGPREMKLVDLQAARTTSATPLEAHDLARVATSADGTSIVVATVNGQLHVFPATGSSEPRILTFTNPGYVYATDFSPDGRWLLAVTERQVARVWSTLDGEAVTPELPLPAMPLSASFSPDGRRFQVSGRDAMLWDLIPDERPAGALSKWAEFLSGHVLEGTRVEALPPVRLVELASDPRVAVADSRDGDAWRWFVAQEALLQRDWTSALAELDVLSSRPGTRWEAHASRGRALAELERWSEAQEAFATALSRRPDSTELRYFHALAAFGGGKAEALGSVCRAGLDELGQTRNPDRAYWLARLCVLDSLASDSERTHVMNLARLAHDTDPDILPYRLTQAAALWRLGAPGDSRSVLERLLQAPDSREGWNGRIEAEIWRRNLSSPSAR